MTDPLGRTVSRVLSVRSDRPELAGMTDRLASRVLSDRPVLLVRRVRLARQVRTVSPARQDLRDPLVLQDCPEHPRRAGQAFSSAGSPTALTPTAQ